MEKSAEGEGKVTSKRTGLGFIKHAMRLKKPCVNCPFLKEGAISLRPGRLEGIVDNLMRDDMSSFPCHKTPHCSKGGEFNDEGTYISSGHEAMCAGAAAYLMKHKSPNVALRIAFAMNAANPTDWDGVKELIID